MPRPLAFGGSCCAAVRGRSAASSSPVPSPGRAAGSPGVPRRQMVGPEDAGAQGGPALLPSGREEEAAAPAAEEKRDAEADGERDGSREGAGARLQRYLAGKRPPNGDACGGGRMTNGDAGFLLPPPPPPQQSAPSAEEPLAAERGEEKLHNGGCAFFLAGPASGGVALEEPLKSCSLAGAAATPAMSPSLSPSASSSSPSSSGSPSPGSEEAESPASLARTLPCLAPPLAFMDINLNSRNTFEVSRRRSAPEHLQPQQPPQPPASLATSATSSAHAAATGSEQGDRAKRLSGIAGSGFAEFFTR